MAGKYNYVENKNIRPTRKKSGKMMLNSYLNYIGGRF
jgi:hypothetical protein